jgi:hypothetical protein
MMTTIIMVLDPAMVSYTIPKKKIFSYGMNAWIILLVACCCMVCSILVLFLLSKKTSIIPSIGGGNLSIVKDLWKKGSSSWNTFNGDSSNRFSVQNGMLRLEYGKNSYAAKSGASFRANPHNRFPSDEVTVSYSIEFPRDFDFKKGGKLPGICIGTSKSDCSAGGDWRKGQGSVRVMWRAENGKNPYAIGYVYTTHGNPKAGANAQGSSSSSAMDPSDRTGHNFWKKGTPFKLKHGWNTISLHVKLNSPGSKNGILEMSVNGVTKKVTDFVVREKSNEKIQSLNFVSFFGGGDASWATPNKVLHVNFKNISVR